MRGFAPYHPLLKLFELSASTLILSATFISKTCTEILMQNISLLYSIFIKLLERFISVHSAFLSLEVLQIH